MSIILASASPRRRELLHLAGITDFIVRPSLAEETLSPKLSPEETVMGLSGIKARSVAEAAERNDVVIAADTLVYLDSLPLGKPQSEAEALRMLSALSGREHHVYTGLTVIASGRSLSAFERTAVRFRPLEKREIEEYVSSGEPMDKAGAYAIQGGAAKFVTGVEGDYYNVIGLPVCRLYLMLRELGCAPSEGEAN